MSHEISDSSDPAAWLRYARGDLPRLLSNGQNLYFPHPIQNLKTRTQNHPEFFLYSYSLHS